MNLLVTGATGHLGREVVRAAVAAGHSVRSLVRPGRGAPEGSEAAAGDLAAGAGLAEALRGIEVVLHAASAPRDPVPVDVEGTRSLLAAARTASVRHFVYVSIVGIDRIPLPYYHAKLAAEGLIEESGVPHSILRVTQFHAFIDAQLGRLDALPGVLAVPAGFRVQSIATSDVVAELCSVSAADPRGRLPDLAGPEALSLSRAARTWLEVRGSRKVVVPLPVPGRVAAALRRGYNTVPDRPGGALTWRAWLEARAEGAAAP